MLLAMLCKVAVCSLCFVLNTITIMDCLCPTRRRSRRQLSCILCSLSTSSQAACRLCFLLETIISQADTKMHLKVFLLSSETQQMVFRVVFIKKLAPYGLAKPCNLLPPLFLFFFMSSSSFSSTQTTPTPKTLKHRTQADTNRFLPSRTMMQLMSRT